jgi:hypothetical protein
MCCRLGRYADGKFDLDAADGPHALDLGDVLYAPNLLEDAQVRGVVICSKDNDQEQPNG